MPRPRLTPADRQDLDCSHVARLAWWLAGGVALTDEDVARALCISEDAAYRLLEDMSRWLPLVRIGGGRWRRMK